MAKYKSGYKRKGSNDKLLTYILIGFAAVVVVILGVLGINSIANPTLGYNDFNDVRLQNFSEVTQQDEEEYFVYFYGERCDFCTDIKSEILGFADSNNADLKVYVIESADPDDYVQITRQGQTINAAPILDPATGLNITGTPTLITVRNGIVVDVSAGPNVIVDVIEQVEAGTYAFIN